MPVDSKLLLFLEGCRLFYYGFPLGKLTLLLSYKNLVIFSKIVAQKVVKTTMKRLFLSPTSFSSWQLTYLVILVPQKAQSSSWQNKKLQTMLHRGIFIKA